MKKIIIAILFILLLALPLCIATLKGFNGNFSQLYKRSNISEVGSPFESSHERASFGQTVAIVNNNRFDLPKNLADFGAPDVGYYNGKFYSYFPPGVSVSIIPMYVLGSHFNANQLIAYATVPLLAALSLVLLFLIAFNILKLPYYISLFTVLIYGFATISWSYSATIYQHTFTVFFMLLGFISAWMYIKSNKSRIISMSLLWVCYGLSGFYDYPNFILLSPLILYAVIGSFRIKENNQFLTVKFNSIIILTSIFFIAVAVLFASYNKITYGDWKTLSNHLPRYEIKNLTTLQGTTKHIDSGNVGGVFLEERIPNGLFELLIADDKGLFVFSPILILALLGIFKICKNTSLEKGILLLVVGLNILLYASFGDPWGGWAFGPRYLLPSMPIFSLFTGIVLAQKSKSILFKILTYLLFIISTSISLLGALTTNMLPPKVEATYLKIRWGIPYAIDVFNKGISGSYVYNNYFSQKISLYQFYTSIFCVVIIVGAFTLFILPIIEKDEH